MNFQNQQGSAYIEYILSAAVLLTASIAIEPALRDYSAGLLTMLSYVLKIPVF
ncbi:MAG: hypothetical protein H0Z38_09560 [Firmicutes bacterium]|nr:hypothetical protein [Bacillota bacterium]